MEAEKALEKQRARAHNNSKPSLSLTCKAACSNPITDSVTLKLSGDSRSAGADDGAGWLELLL